MQKLIEVDQELAQRYGAYASYKTDLDPVIETFGDDSAAEVDRLLDRFAQSESHVLDLGCGAGFTTCRLALNVAEVWGFDMDSKLLAAARLRAQAIGLENVHFISGNVTHPEDVKQLPENTFDLVLSRRGPNVNAVLSKLKPDALVIQELFQGYLGLLEMFGRKSFLADIGDNPRWLVDEYAWINLFPVSVKEYYFESYFKDTDHLAAYLAQSTALYEWPLPPMPYQEPRDCPALELYARYNQTPRGIRVVHVRGVYLFRRTAVLYAPADPAIRPASRDE